MQTQVFIFRFGFYPGGGQISTWLPPPPPVEVHQLFIKPFSGWQTSWLLPAGSFLCWMGKGWRNLLGTAEHQKLCWGETGVSDPQPSHYLPLWLMPCNYPGYMSPVSDSCNKRVWRIWKRLFFLACLKEMLTAWWGSWNPTGNCSKVVFLACGSFARLLSTQSSLSSFPNPLFQCHGA